MTVIWYNAMGELHEVAENTLYAADDPNQPVSLWFWIDLGEPGVYYPEGVWTKKATSVTSSVAKKVATLVANTAYRYTASKTTKTSSTKKSGNSYSSNTSSAKKTASSAKKSTTSTQNKTTTTTVKTSDKVKNLVKNMAVTVIKAQQPVYSAGKKVVSTINNINSNIREKAKNSKAPDVVQSGLDVAGLIPGVGEIADGTNALIYAGRGDYVNAGLSAAACVPFIGSFSTGAKTVGKGVKVVKATKTVANGADTAKKISTAAKTVDKAKDVTKQVSNAVDAGKAVTKGGNKSVDDIVGVLKETTNRKGITKNFESKGGFSQTLEDFDSLQPSNVKNIQTQYGQGKVGKLNDDRPLLHVREVLREVPPLK